MKSFDEVWENIHATQEWGKYPSEQVIRFVARNYYGKERHSIKMLDFGVGGGNHTWYLAREGFDTYGFDGSKSAVEKVKERLKAEELQADVRVRDALELDYQMDFFDCIIDSATIVSNMYGNIVKMYQETYRLLKQGGKLYSITFTTGTTGCGTGIELEKNTFKDITEGSLKGRGTCHFFEKEELNSLLETIGFQKIIIDSLRFTDREDIVEQFLVQAEK